MISDALHGQRIRKNTNGIDIKDLKKVSNDKHRVNKRSASDGNKLYSLIKQSMFLCSTPKQQTNFERLFILNSY